MKPTRAAASIPASTAGKPIAPRQRLEAIRAQCVETDRHPMQPGIQQRTAPRRPSRTPFVVSARSLIAVLLANMRISTGRSRRSSGSPPVIRTLSTPSSAKMSTRRLISSKSQNVLARQPGVLLLRHAVRAAEIAAVGDRQAQIAQRPTEACRRQPSAPKLVDHGGRVKTGIVRGVRGVPASVRRTAIRSRPHARTPAPPRHPHACPPRVFCALSAAMPVDIITFSSDAPARQPDGRSARAAHSRSTCPTVTATVPSATRGVHARRIQWPRYRDAERDRCGMRICRSGSTA